MVFVIINVIVDVNVIIIVVNVIVNVYVIVIKKRHHCIPDKHIDEMSSPANVLRCRC